MHSGSMGAWTQCGLVRRHHPVATKQSLSTDQGVQRGFPPIRIGSEWFFPARLWPSLKYMKIRSRSPRSSSNLLSCPSFVPFHFSLCQSLRTFKSARPSLPVGPSPTTPIHVLKRSGSFCINCLPGDRIHLSMTYSPISISSSSPANSAPPLFTTPEAPFELHFIEQPSSPISRPATLVFQSPTTPDTWVFSSPDSESVQSGAFSGIRGTMEGGGDGDKTGKGKGKGKASRQSTPSASSSQGDMADNEAEGGSSHAGEQSNPPPPPKKKRTRTLTTPHQAAVLHALLAQVCTSADVASRPELTHCSLCCSHGSPPLLCARRSGDPLASVPAKCR